MFILANWIEGNWPRSLHQWNDMAKTVQYIRWNLKRAAAEFGLEEHSLSKRIKQKSILPGKDKRYSTKQIAHAVFGDLEFERIRETAAKADQLERENAVAQRKFIATDEVQRKLTLLGMAYVGIIESSKLSDEEKALLRNAMADAVAALK